MPHWLGRSAWAALLVCIAHASAAEDMPDAVGRVAPVNAAGDRVGTAICTGLLIAPDLVMTAGHCLPKRDGTATYAFEAGLSGAQSVAKAVGRIVQPITPRPDGPMKLDNDLALLLLDVPIDPAIVAPIHLLANPEAPDTVFFGYDRTTPDLPPAAKPCALQAAWPTEAPRVVAFDCTVVSGNSGGPVLARYNNEWALVAIMVARGTAPLASFAVVPDRTLPSISK